ncbi:MAG: DUF2796 domain-containing protein [Rhodospirillales bacterium]
MSNNPLTTGAALLAVTLCVAGPAGASGEHDAHVHGAGEINVVVEGNDVLMELTLPGADVVGFEHRAETDTDVAAVQDALETLENAGAIFALPAGAGCELAAAHAESSLLEEIESHGHKDDPKDGNRHEDGHDAGHGDFGAFYEFTCAAPDALKDIEVRLFALFPSLKEVEVQAVTAKGQWAKELTPTDNRLMLVF